MTKFKEGDFLENFQLENDPRTVLQIMEHDKQRYLFHELFENLVDRGQIDRARKIAWILDKEYGVTVDGLRESMNPNY
jgi:hypothetical protein